MKQLRENLEVVIDTERSPAMLVIVYNDTETRLARVTREDGSVFWVGTPMDKDGRFCRYALVVEPTGYLSGSAAINFIALRGWSATAAKPTAEEKARVAAEFRRAFIQACLLFGQRDVSWSVKHALESAAGLKTETGEITDQELVLLALMGVPHDAIQVARSNHRRFNVDVPAFIGQMVRNSYAQVVPGTWDNESEEVAMTSSLKEAHVHLMRLAGLKFQRAEARRRRSK